MLSEKEFEERLRVLEDKLLNLTSDMLFKGKHPSPFVGTGYETCGIAEYDPSIHEIFDIDFELSAQEPDKRKLVRLYYDEEIRPTYVVLDTSSAMYFGDKLDTALLVAWALASVFIMDGPVWFLEWGELLKPSFSKKDFSLDELGLSLKEWRKDFEIRVADLTQQIFSLRRKLINVSHPDMVSRENLKSLLKRETTKANLVLASDFISPGDMTGIFRDLRAAEFTIFAVMVRDYSEEKIPDVGDIEVVDAESKKYFLLPTANSRKKAVLEEKIKSELESFEKQCQASAVLFSRVVGPDDVFVPIHFMLQKLKDYNAR